MLSTYSSYIPICVYVLQVSKKFPLSIWWLTCFIEIFVLSQKSFSFWFLCIPCEMFFQPSQIWTPRPLTTTFRPRHIFWSCQQHQTRLFRPNFEAKRSGAHHHRSMHNISHGLGSKGSTILFCCPSGGKKNKRQSFLPLLVLIIKYDSLLKSSF